MTKYTCQRKSKIQKRFTLLYKNAEILVALKRLKVCSFFAVVCCRSFKGKTVCCKCFVVCKKSGYLFKRSEKNKKWKSMFFVLQMDGTDTHLLIFESPKVCWLSIKTDKPAPEYLI